MIMKDFDEEDMTYVTEQQVASIIKKLLFEIEKLKDENESLWFMLEEVEQSGIEGSDIVAQSLSELKKYKIILKQTPEQA